MQIGRHGAKLFPGELSREQQSVMVVSIRALLPEAPLYTPTMPNSGKPLSVRMTNFGEVGWMSDKAGYRYQRAHPETGKAWPAIPDSILSVWASLLPVQPLPDACLVNFYAPTAKMGLHQDRDEQDFSVPVLSISLGDTALFRLGGQKRSDPTQSFKLSSGDVMMLAGEDRLAFHGVDRIYPGTSTLLKQGGRISITLRKAL